MARQLPVCHPGAGKYGNSWIWLLVCLGWAITISTTSSSTVWAFQAPIPLARRHLSPPPPHVLFVNHHNDDAAAEDFGRNHNHIHDNESVMDRRNFFTSTTAAAAAALMATTTTAFPHSALAGGLLQFPCDRPLKNRYHFMRAGASLLEDEGLWCTNPLFMTNRENALSEKATKNVLEACEAIKASGHLPTVAYHSLAANGIDTADLIGQQLRMGRDRILPEFTYLDPRGVGLWDSNEAEVVKPAVWAMDVLEAGKEGTGGRPPANEDGTPNETLADQFVRLRQFLSLQESRTSGENILLIFPDGTGPALLSAMIAGIPLSQVHALEYAPAEVRLDVTRESVLDLYASKKNDETFLATIEQGKEQLELLRNQKTMISLKDQRAEQERLEMERVFLRDKEKKQQRERELLAKREQERKDKLQAKLQAAAGGGGGALASSSITPRAAAKAPMDEVDFNLDGSSAMAALGIGVAGLGVAAATGLLGGGGDDGSSEDKVTTARTNRPVPTSTVNSMATASDVVVGRNGTIAMGLQTASLNPPTSEPSTVASTTEENQITGKGGDAMDQSNDSVADDNDNVDEELDKLEEAQRAMDGLLMQDAEKESSNGPISDELRQLEAAQKAMNEYLDMDDGANDWLQVLAEIRDEPDDEVDAINGENRT